MPGGGTDPEEVGVRVESECCGDGFRVGRMWGEREELERAVEAHFGLMARVGRWVMGSVGL